VAMKRRKPDAKEYMLGTAKSKDVQYETVIGMEVHAQLRTASKIFCACSTRFGAEPNTQICPVCLGMPGVLPVLNKRVVEMGIAVGLATHSRIAPNSRFARKNYFYPDLPKGYQISQFELPLAEGGYIEIPVEGEIRRIGLRRVHMEEDAGKNLHEGLAGASHVDLNRAGVPLLEIVSEPEIHSGVEAVAYLKTLRDILIYLDVSDGNMEEGSFRCEPNISLRPVGEKTYGTRVEVKNINSFRYVMKAVEYEIRRQEAVLRDGGRIVQETRLWNSTEDMTVTMRSKEEAHDYRYFPEPDLVPLILSEAWVDQIRAGLPELPDVKRKRFVREYGIREYDAEILTATKSLAGYFEETVRLFSPASPQRAKTASNWIMTELLRELNTDNREAGDSPVTAEHLAGLLRLIDDGTISGKIAKEVFMRMYRTGKAAEAIVHEEGLTQVSDEGELEILIARIMESHPKELEGYRGGKEKLLGFFVGQVMKETGGKAHPGKVNDLLKKKLAGP
jgi:aspartyl-tRNA(Asn)/glutamyl-tRNA(Gln) amidotransferase subunit B